MEDKVWMKKRKHVNKETNEKDSEKKAKTNETTPIKSDSNNINSSIYSNNNDIYFYSSIDKSTSISFQHEVEKVYKSILENIATAHAKGYKLSFPPITIHYNSPGGGVFAAFSMIDYLRLLKQRDRRVKIHSIVEGRAASAATLLSVTADKRYATKYGYMLIHQLSSMCWGKYNELKDEIENCDALMNRIKKIYKDHTNIPEDELDKILSHDLYWDATKCLEVGLIDEVL